MTNRTYILSPQPGIQRDGTKFASRHWIDGQWVRFQRGLPRKMGGYKELYNALPNIPREIYILPVYPNLNVYIGDYVSIKYLPIDQFGNVLGPLVDRTPNYFNINTNNTWKLDNMFSTVSNSSVIIAHATQNLSAIDNTVETPIYYGDSASTDKLTPTGISVSGGIVVLHPYLFMYGNNGDVKWSVINDPTTIDNEFRATGSKIVAGFQTRGGNNSPAGLLWSLDSLIRITYVVGDPDFRFDTVTDESSIMSTRGIVEYDGLYYWVGLDKFLVYNGTVQEIPNNMSTNFFFDNVNYAQRQKVWATKITRFGEIWWFFPYNKPGLPPATECNHAVIYNIREQTWYDTEIARGDGYFTQVFTNPIWAGNTFNSIGDRYSLWMHEKGFNQVGVDNSSNEIDSYVESNIFSLCGVGIDGQVAGINKNEYLYSVEPDFNQQGSMTLTVNGKAYANSDNVSASYPFEQTTEKIDMREQRREMSLKFDSNVLNGFYEMGQVLCTIKTGDDRP